jgi:FG-GAP repeat
MSAKSFTNFCISVLLTTSLLGCGWSSSDDTDARSNTAKHRTFGVGGKLSGLAKGQTISIALNDHLGHEGHTTTLSKNGRFSLGQMRYGMEFAAILVAQPEGQTCTITSPDDVVDADLNNIDIRCSERQFALTGPMVGVKSDLTLVNKITGEQIFLSAGADTFAFSQLASSGQAYDIQVIGAPEGSICTVRNGTGIAGSNLSNLQVLCNPLPIPVPEQPHGLQVDFGIKNYTFSWSPSPTATYYELAQDLDGEGPQLESVIGVNLQTNRYSYAINTLLPSLLNAQYKVRACNAGGCSAFSATITPDVSKAIGYLKASNSTANLNFGFFSMAISADGNTLAVGASDETSNAIGVNGNQSDTSLTNAGAVYLFSRSNNIWSQQAYIKASNTRANSFFGVSVALSSDGNTLAVGASSESSNGIGVAADQTNQAAPGAGAVYLYKRGNSTWTQQSYIKASNTRSNSGFGVQVALSADGGTLAVGAWTESSNATGIDGNQSDLTAANSGAVYVFTYDTISWNQQAYVKPSNTKAELRFGQRIALSANGNTMAVGSSRESSNATGVNGNQSNVSSSEAGAVYVFTRAQAVWQQQAYLKASNTNANHIGIGDRFGIAIALSADGNTLAVGAWGEDSGATGINANQNDESAQESGAVYLFSRSNLVWSQQAYLKASNTRAGDRFGTRVALSADGNTLAVGAQEEDGGNAGISNSQTSNSQTSNSQTSVTTLTNAGAVYLYNREQSSWSQKSYLKSGVPRANAYFGWGLAMSADANTLAIGAAGESSNATGISGNQNDASAVNAGAVYVY